MSCPMCGGLPMLLGSLGRSRHYRCRNCGWDWSRSAKRKAARPRSRKATADEAERFKREGTPIRQEHVLDQTVPDRPIMGAPGHQNPNPSDVRLCECGVPFYQHRSPVRMGIPINFHVEGRPDASSG